MREPLTRAGSHRPAPSAPSSCGSPGLVVAILLPVLIDVIVVRGINYDTRPHERKHHGGEPHGDIDA